MRSTRHRSVCAVVSYPSFAFCQKPSRPPSRYDSVVQTYNHLGLTMSEILDDGPEVILLAIASLALITALILAWRCSALRDEHLPTSESDIADGTELGSMAGLEDHLARELLSAARAAAQIPPNALAADEAPYPTERITATAHNVMRQLHVLRGESKDKWMTSACIGQARLVGVSAIQVETAAHAAARRPNDRQVADRFAYALAEFDQAVDNLHRLVQSSIRNDPQ